MITLKKAFFNNSINQVFSFIISFSYQILISRFLLPEDFGLINFIYSFYLILVLIISSGMSSTIVNFDNNSFAFSKLIYLKFHRVSFFIFLFIILLSLSLYYIAIIDIKILLIILIFLSTLILKLKNVILEALFQKNLMFDSIRKISLFSNILGFLLPLLLVINNFGVYTLALHYLFLVVFQFLGLSNTPLAQRFFKSKISSFNSSSKKENLFTRYSYLTSIVNYIVRYMDTWFITINWGLYTSGIFSRATLISKTPIELVTSLIRPVLHPYVTKTKDDEKKYDLLIFLINLFSIISIFGQCLLFFYGESIIIFVLGPQWIESIILIKIFSFSMLPIALTSIISPFYLGNENSKIPFLSTLLKTILLLPLYFLFSFTNNLLFFIASYVVVNWIIFIFLFVYFIFKYSKTIYFYFLKILFSSILSFFIVLVFQTYLSSFSIVGFALILFILFWQYFIYFLKESKKVLSLINEDISSK